MRTLNGVNPQFAATKLFASVIDAQNRVVKDFGLLQQGQTTTPIPWDGSITGGQLRAGDYRVLLRLMRSNGFWDYDIAAGEAPIMAYSLKFQADTAGSHLPGQTQSIALEHWLGAPLPPAFFGFAKFKMLPVTISAGNAAVLELSANAGLEVFQPNGSRLNLPFRWQPSSFSADALQLKLLVNSVEPGVRQLAVTYGDGSNVLATERVEVRMSRFDGMVGLHQVASPYIAQTRRIQEGDDVYVGIDPSLFSDRVSKVADIYVVPHRSTVEWSADQTLHDVGVVERIEIRPGSKSNNRSIACRAAVTNPELPLTLPATQRFDVVLDFGNFQSGSSFVGDGRLDPGDLLLSDWEGSISVEDWKRTTNGTNVQTYRAPDDLKISALAADGSPFDNLDGDAVAELRGMVVTPVGLGALKSPLVVFAHGNHLPFRRAAKDPQRSNMTTDENFSGYRYLQEFLAERGVASISVDLDGAFYADYQPGSPFGIRVRSWIVLKNLEWALENLPQLGNVDRSAVFLVGHSRGGQAVKDAEYLMLRPPLWPANSEFKSDAAIRGVLGLAPTSFDYISTIGLPSNVPLAIVYGTSDGDVSRFSAGVRPFYHIDSSIELTRGIGVLGANHNFFNSSWRLDDARDEMGGVWDLFANAPIPLLAPLSDSALLLSRSDQEAVAKELVGGFVGTTLAERDAATWLRVPGAEPQGVQKFVFAVQGRSKNRTILDDYEGSFPGASTRQVDWAEKGGETALNDFDITDETELGNRFFQSSHGAILDWVKVPQYLGAFTPLVHDFSRARTISFRVAQKPDTKCSSSPALSGASLNLKDGSGRPASVPLGDLPQVVSSNSVQFNRCYTGAFFRTVWVPLEALTVDGAGFDLWNVVEMSVDGTSGVVAVDDFEVE